MKPTFFSYLLPLLSLLLLASCSALQKSKVYPAVPSGQKPSAIAPPKTVEAAKHKDKDKDKNKDKSETAAPAIDISHRSQVPSSDASRHHKTYAQTPASTSLEGEWTVYSVRSTRVEGEERPYITFDPAASRFYGSNGCNIINGDLTLGTGRDDRLMRLDNVISTMRMCQDAPYEYLINLALTDVRSLAFRQQPPVTFLDLRASNGKTIMVLRRHNMDFLNGAWSVTSLNGSPLHGEDPATLTIDIPNLRLHGSTGCNIFNGDIFIDPDKLHSLQFLTIGSTRKMCPPSSRDTEFLLALEEVETARSTSPSAVELLDRSGRTLFTLTRLKINNE